LEAPWPLAYYAFIGIPRVIRDRVYDVVARKRYDWFGKREACRMPTPELQARFIGGDADA
jgi:predicted DCC family thiol-disulfide oxidoreductase YuxK